MVTRCFAVVVAFAGLAGCAIDQPEEELVEEDEGSEEVTNVALCPPEGCGDFPEDVPPPPPPPPPPPRSDLYTPYPSNFDPQFTTQGTPIVTWFYICNQGVGPSTSFRVKLVGSQQTYPYLNTTLMHTTVAPLAAGACTGFSGPVVTLPRGDWFFVTRIDEPHAVIESNESNNTRVTRYVIL